MTVEFKRRDGIAWVTFNRPDKRNAMTDEMWEELEGHLSELDPGGRDRVLVITGAGGSFSAGSDVGGFVDDLESLSERMEVSNRCVTATHELSIPTIAAVDGIAAGSALNLALACDLVWASQRARFAQLFIHIGLSLDSGASWLLPRLVGERRAREMALLGETLDAGQALDAGLITRVLSEDEFADETFSLATRLGTYNHAGLAGTKQLLNETWERDLNGAMQAETANQVDVIRSEQAMELISHFTGTKGAS